MTRGPAPRVFFGNERRMRLLGIDPAERSV
jgi:hypothetical protein